MTDNIIKSLKWLIFNFPKIENPKDDADRLCNCINLYCQNAVDEINRQKAEIERLQKECANFDGIARYISQGRQYRGETIACFNDLLECIETAKSEAITEFAERLKAKAEPMPCFSHLKFVYTGNIDRIAKEMKGEQ